MTLNELIAGLNKLTQLAGDLPIVVRNAENDAETVLHTIGINFDPSGATVGGAVTINHGPATPPSPLADQPPAGQSPVEQPPAEQPAGQ